MNDSVIFEAVVKVNRMNSENPNTAALVLHTNAEVFAATVYKNMNVQYSSSVTLTDVSISGRWITGKRCKRDQSGGYELISGKELFVNTDHVVAAVIADRTTRPAA